MIKPKVSIVDFGRGNLFSVTMALSFVGAEANVSSNPKILATAERLLLPGVGAFGDGMQTLREKNLDEAVLSFQQTGRPLFGICLGAQFLLCDSHEHGSHRGLGLIPGQVEQLPFPAASSREKVPNVGWRRLFKSSTGWEGTPLENVEEGHYAYFVHSYYLKPDNQSDVLAVQEFNGRKVAAVVARDNIVGSQFHPEKSGEVGLAILGSWLDL